MKQLWSFILGFLLLGISVVQADFYSSQNLSPISEIEKVAEPVDGSYEGILDAVFLKNNDVIGLGFEEGLRSLTSQQGEDNALNHIEYLGLPEENIIFVENIYSNSIYFSGVTTINWQCRQSTMACFSFDGSQKNARARVISNEVSLNFEDRDYYIRLDQSFVFNLCPATKVLKNGVCIYADEDPDFLATVCDNPNDWDRDSKTCKRIIEVSSNNTFLCGKDSFKQASDFTTRIHNKTRFFNPINIIATTLTELPSGTLAFVSHAGRSGGMYEWQGNDCNIDDAYQNIACNVNSGAFQSDKNTNFNFSESDLYLSFRVTCGEAWENKTNKISYTIEYLRDNN